MTTARILEVPGEITGNGDDVIVLSGGTPDTADITGNAASRFFAVIAHDVSSRDLLVNTTDPYEGTVILDPDALVIEVTAADGWSILRISDNSVRYRAGWFASFIEGVADHVRTGAPLPPGDGYHFIPAG